jgi:hypothetical protein
VSGFELAGLCFAAGVGFLVALVVVASSAVRRYPNEADPARNARRFVIPALVFAILGVGLVVFSVGAGFTALVLSVTS